METWQIHPKKSVGPLALNASLEDIDPILGTYYDCFSRGSNQTLAYKSSGVHVEIGDDRRTRAVTIFHPCRASLNGIELLGREVSDVARDLDNAGLAFQIVDAGLWSEELLMMLVEQEGRIDGVEVRRVPY